jgi:predicted nucleic acid-binding protein
MIIADTSGLLAALDPDEVHHDACRRIVETAAEPLMMSPFVLCELDYLVIRKLGTAAELLLLDDVAAGAYRLAPMESGDVASARSVVDRYRDLGIGLTDASVAVLADRHDTADVLSLDRRHFRAMTRANGEPFRLLPEDR